MVYDWFQLLISRLLFGDLFMMSYVTSSIFTVNQAITEMVVRKEDKILIESPYETKQLWSTKTSVRLFAENLD